MRRPWIFLAGFAAAATLSGQAPSGPTPSQPTPTVDELIRQNIAARGGLAKIKSIQSMRLTGTMTVGEERMPSILEIKRPNKTRWEFTVDGQPAVQAYDGTVGWTIMPFSGSSEPERMTDEDLKDIELQADIDGPLVDYREKGSEITLGGRVKVGDRDAWKLVVKLKDGDVRELYLDATTHLQFMAVTRRTVEGASVEVESRIGDYREVGGVLLPHSFEAAAKGVAQKQSLKFDRIELNVPIDDVRFHMPERRRERPEPEGTPTVS